MNRFKYYATFEKLTFAYTLIHVCHYKISVRIRTTMNWLLATTFFIFQKTIRNFFLLLCFSRKKNFFVVIRFYCYFLCILCQCVHIWGMIMIFFFKKSKQQEKKHENKKETSVTHQNSVCIQHSRQLSQKFKKKKKQIIMRQIIFQYRK